MSIFLEKKVYIPLFPYILDIMSGIYGGYSSVPFGTVYTVTWEAVDKVVLAILHLDPPTPLKRRPLAT